MKRSIINRQRHWLTGYAVICILGIILIGVVEARSSR